MGTYQALLVTPDFAALGSIEFMRAGDTSNTVAIS